MVDYIKRKPLLLLLAIAILGQVAFLKQPPRSVHVWRQSNTLAIARNFYEEDMNILHPRMDKRFEKSGLTGTTFPLYEFGLATVYKVFGFTHYYHRYYSLFIFLMSVVALYFLILKFTNSVFQSVVGVWVYMWSPIIYYYAITAIPDMLALCLAFWSWLAFYYQRRNNSLFILLSVILFTLASLVKYQYILFGIPMLYTFIQKIRIKNYNNIAYYSAYFFTPFILFVWTKYERKLNDISGVLEFVTVPRGLVGFKEGISIFIRNSVSDFPELIMGYSIFILFIFLLFYTIKKRVLFKNKYWGFIWMFLALIIYYIVGLSQMKNHQYYLIPFIPIIVLFIALGIHYFSKKDFLVAKVLLIMALPLAIIRIVPSRRIQGTERVPIDLYNQATRVEIDAWIPDGKFTIVGPDKTGCVFHYFSHSKGLPVKDTDELKHYFDDYIANGKADYVLWDTLKEPLPKILQVDPYKFIEVGSFKIVKLK